MDDRIISIPQKLVKQHETRDPFLLAVLTGCCVKFINTKYQKGFCRILLNNKFIFIKLH